MSLIQIPRWKLLFRTPSLSPPQQPAKSITNHFHTQRNHPLKTLSSLKPHTHLSKAKQVAKSQLPRLKQQNPKRSTSMHANLRPNVPTDHSTNNNVPILNPLGHPLSLPGEPSFILTTLDPHKHTAVTFPITNHEIVGNPPGHSCRKVADNPEQQLYPKQLVYPPDKKEDGTVNPMEFYDGDPQLAIGNKEENIMSDDENTIVNETPGVHGGGALGPSMTFKTLVSNYRLNLVALFEPRISGSKADGFIKKNAFQRSHRVEARGFSGGIWILWDDSFEVEFIINHNQFIHFKIIDSKGCSSWVTAVYASPIPMVRKILWSALDEVAKSVDGPWMIGGDFNAIRRVSEKKGGSARISGVCDLFNGWFHRNHLMELVFKGPKYTWSRGNLSKRLDRVICNEEWMMMNDEAEVFHLPKLNSNNRPVMFRCRKNNFAPTGVKPFRFLAPWLTDERFQPFVENNWRYNLNYTNVVADFINKLGNWNKDIFGNIFKGKKELLARIGGIQRFLEKRHSRSLSKLESKLKRDLEKVLTQEEVLWFQKSRREWIVCGDRNTAFFHQNSIERRRRNKVGMIKNDEGQWMHDEADIKADAVSYFCNLYTKEGGVHVQYPFTLDFPLIDNVVLNSLIRVVYKTITKMVANRLKTILPQIIGPAQTSFVPGRHIIENIIVAQEIIHSMRNKGGKTGQMAIKVDLEKAYDRLSWDFIHETLRVIGLPMDLICIIMECITTVSMQLLWNAEASSEQAQVINEVLDNFCVSSGKKVWDHVLKGTRWALGDGKRVKFWWDLWLSEADNLQSYAQNPIPDQLINLCVADFSDNNGNWNWHLFAHLLPNHIILKIASVKAPCAYSGEDQCYWAYSNTGHFTAKSAYLSLHQPDNVADKSLWNLAWKWNGPQSIRTFIWLAISNRLKTKSELLRRHITMDATCCSCSHHLEDTIHVLRDCIIARQIYYNLKNMGLIRRDEKWPCIFGVALWWIWYWRNQFIHNDAHISVANIVLDVTHRAAEINASMENICRPGHERIIKWLKWMAPPWPFFKLNTDGARKISGNASAGGLIRNYCGEWVHGFGMNIGHCTITGAELWGLLQGLQLAWNIGIRQLLVEVDSRCITEILTTDTNHPNANSSLIQGIKRLLNMEWQVSLSHSYRETNFAAGYLTNQALLLPLGVHVFPTPPSGTEGWLLHDVSGTAYPRMVIA
ncbi:putative ribonuclease H protein [Citrus sinensis]|uniref:Ribonuclease H protein n=1 Tax=Citrus sinensis TaxID=2711 RepID=A0ACB8JP77_CITSI|nr:putative ribonuclease H protein [Citrus sinensis]